MLKRPAKMRLKSLTKKISVCQNHLPALYEALKNGNLLEAEKIEHELTPSERCVACAYIFKTNISIKAAFEDFLNKNHLSKINSSKQTGFFQLTFWLERMTILVCTIMAAIFLEQLTKKLILSFNAKNIPPFSSQTNFFSLNIMEWVVVFLLSISLFLLIDNLFVD
ncbi:hypothetical protein HY025_03840 [Candidatus Daviesbacteria bacterium]|nr:hypothetical protein [Candidatus Daviesbacteria bacterium]